MRFRRPKASVKVGNPRRPWHVLIPMLESHPDAVELKALCGSTWDNRKVPAEVSKTKLKPKGWQCEKCQQLLEQR